DVYKRQGYVPGVAPYVEFFVRGGNEQFNFYPEELIIPPGGQGSFTATLRFPGSSAWQGSAYHALSTPVDLPAGAALYEDTVDVTGKNPNRDGDSAVDAEKQFILPGQNRGGSSRTHTIVIDEDAAEGETVLIGPRVCRAGTNCDGDARQLSSNSLKLIIQNPDVSGTPSVSIEDSATVEEGNVVAIQVLLQHAQPDDEDVTLTWTATTGGADGTAAAADLDLPDTRTLTIDGGETSGFILIPIVDNTRLQEDRTFTVTLALASGETHATLADEDAKSLVTITDNDAARAFTFVMGEDDASPRHGAYMHPVNVTVERAGRYQVPIYIGVNEPPATDLVFALRADTTGVTNPAPAAVYDDTNDVNPFPETLIVPAGELVGTTTVFLDPTAPGTSSGRADRFFVVASPPAGYTVDPQGTDRVEMVVNFQGDLDVDIAGSRGVDFIFAPSYLEIEQGGFASFAVVDGPGPTRRFAAGGQIAVEFDPRRRYKLPDGVGLHFDVGRPKVRPDRLGGMPGTRFIPSLEAGATTIIHNDEFSFPVPDNSRTVSEGGAAAYVVAPSRNITVSVAETVPPGVYNLTGPSEDTRGYILNSQSQGLPTPYSFPGPFILRVLETGTSIVQLSLDEYSVAEDDGRLTIPVTITPALARASEIGLVFGTDTVAGTNDASPITDYTPAETPLVLPAGATTAFITVPLVDDDFREQMEVFQVRLVPPDNAPYDLSLIHI
ncbi:MAG: hypothetical protein MPK62_06955, partial [Alphaproteobacteria bacterium]|nr:hypothetical protein [Alphaproteobacteria bacterium]